VRPHLAGFEPGHLAGFNRGFKCLQTGLMSALIARGFQLITSGSLFQLRIYLVRSKSIECPPESSRRPRKRLLVRTGGKDTNNHN
jgi:hypothetical protein